ncbi:MAG TPA: hypothetical protein VJ001_09315 [Rhodocyclaceae bacterium]|nr:hypothetical protein [Rhodocyclaceae bacterium]
MPILPSGRRIEFSLDRFYALLGQMESQKALNVVGALQEPDDLLLVLDAVHFGMDSGSPYFANYIAADWESYAAEWNVEDKDALRAWFASSSARFYRAEAITGIKTLVNEMVCEKATPSFCPSNPAIAACLPA